MQVLASFCLKSKQECPFYQSCYVPISEDVEPERPHYTLAKGEYITGIALYEPTWK